MNEMIEKVARALAYELDGEPEFTSPGYEAAMMKGARAAIQAMRTPNEGVIRKGADTMMRRSQALVRREARRERSLWIWEAMIDEALK